MECFTVIADNINLCKRKIEEIYNISKNDYQIISCETHQKNGFLGLFPHESVEVKFTLRTPTKTLYPNPRVPVSKPAVQNSSAWFEEEKRKILNSTGVAPLDVATKQMMSDLKEIKDKLAEQKEKNQVEHENLKKLEDLLSLNDFSFSFIKEILDKSKKEFSLDELDDFEIMKEKVIKWIGEKISVYHEHNTSRPQIIVLIGPTGVGKTTTIAKFAAAFSGAIIKNSTPKHIKIITIDNYRLGAIQQLEKYGEILLIPVIAAKKRTEIERVIRDSSDDTDIILVDTIGNGPHEFKRLGEMREMLEGCGSAFESHLAMSATTKISDMREIIQQYEQFGFSYIVMTKMDETMHVGNIISLLSEKNKAISYCTVGQNVPNDIEKATVSGMLARLEGFNIDKSKLDEMFPTEETSQFNWRQ